MRLGFSDENLLMWWQAQKRQTGLCPSLFFFCDLPPQFHVKSGHQSHYLSLQRNEGDLFHRLWHIMNEILDLRRQVLVGHLTHDRMKDVKRHITARLDWGNEWVPAVSDDEGEIAQRDTRGAFFRISFSVRLSFSVNDLWRDWKSLLLGSNGHHDTVCLYLCGSKVWMCSHGDMLLRINQI